MSGIGLMPVSGSGIAGQVPPSRPGVAKRATAESVLWLPSMSSYVVGWLDTDQGMTVNGSNQIEDWVARKGDFGLDPFSGQEPTVTAIGDSYTAWRCAAGKAFDEDASHGGDWLTFSKGVEDVWIFTVVRPNFGAVDNRTLVSISTGTSTSSSRMILMIDDQASSPPNNLQVGGRINDADSYSATLGNTDLVGDPRTDFVVAGRFAAAMNRVEAWVDDVLDDFDDSWQASPGFFESTDAQDVTVGDDDLAGGDIIVCAGATGFMTTDLRQRIFAYLAHKAGLESQLPGSNPYQSAPPMT